MKTTKTRAIAAAVAGALGLGALRYQRNTRRVAVRALREAIAPPQRDETDDATIDLTEGRPAADPAHAPGHRHLPPPPAGRRARPVVRWRPRADRIGHPGRFG